MARVAELVDAPDLKSVVCKDVRVRVPPWAPSEQIINLYHNDRDRDDDKNRWNGATTENEFAHWRQVLKSKDVSAVEHILQTHHQYNDLNCSYEHDWNDLRWQKGASLIMKHSSCKDVVIEIGAGSHATVAGLVLANSKVKCYIVCDLVPVLLLAYYNISKNYKTHYVTSGDSLETLIEHNECIMLPHHMADKLYSLNQSLYYNSYSFSEMSDIEIREYMDVILTTNSRLVSENYMTGNGRCHLCNVKYRALKHYIPTQLKIISKSVPTTPTNPGSEVIVACTDTQKKTGSYEPAFDNLP